MPDSSLTAAIKEAYATAPQGEVILHTLEFRHPSFINDVGSPAAIRVVHDHADLNAKLESTAPLNPSEYVTFIAFAFDFSLPEVQQSAMPEIVITIDNVSQEIEANLALAVASPYKVEVTYRPFLNTDLTGPQMDPPLTLTLTHVEANDFQITARASFSDMANKLFPGVDYTAETFPGLMR